MSTAAITKIIKLAGSKNPSGSIAIYGGTIGDRKATINGIQNDLYKSGLNVVEFNARRYLSENDLSQPLIQQLITELKTSAGSSGATADLVKSINDSAPATNSTHLSSDNRIELIHLFDSSLKKLAAMAIRKKPLIILIQGLERANLGSLTGLSDFVSDYLNIHGFLFIISVGEDILEKELSSINSSLTNKDYLEDVFTNIVEINEEINEEITKESEVVTEELPIEKPNNDDLFAPPVGLEVESGSEIASRRKGKTTPKAPRRTSSGFKVRELAGKKTVVKKNAIVKKRTIKKVMKKSNRKKFQPVIPKKENIDSIFLKPVQDGDLFTVKEFWGKASKLNYEEFQDIVKKIIKETDNSNSRIRATAITALASIANGVSWEMPQDIMDKALILTSDGSKEVRDSAADAIKEMNKAGIDTNSGEIQGFSSPVATTKNSGELKELDAAEMLGTESGSISSMNLGGGSGGVKMMGGPEKTVINDAPEFKVSQEVPSFQDETKPKFKPKDEEKKTPQFKPKKEKKAMFKVVD